MCRRYLERFGLVYTDFGFGSDPNAPGADTPVYDPTINNITGVCGLACVTTEVPDPALASAQKRYAKSSVQWLQGVWRTNELRDPSYFQYSTTGAVRCFGDGTSTVSGDEVQCDWGQPLEPV